MKAIRKIIHRTIKALGLHKLMGSLSEQNTFFLKFVPTPEFFKNGENFNVTREKVNFRLYPNDYMQWHVFASLEDNSYQKAFEVLKKVEKPVILDIGANIGAFSLTLGAKLKESHSIFTIKAFEPNPAIYEKLSHNLSLNPGLEKHIALEPIALGNENSNVEFIVSPNSGNAHVVGKTEQAENTISVEQQKLDDYVANNQINQIDFIKLDVEGHEPMVLEGATKTIEKFKPAMFVEITDSWFRKNNSSAWKVLDYFKNLNYQIFIETEKEFVPLSNASEKLLNQHQYNIFITQ